MVALLRGDRKNFRGLPPAGIAPMDLEEEDEEDREDRAKRVRTDAALRLDDRRFNHAQAKEDYVRNICLRPRQDSEGGKSTSRVPVLGRGLEDEDGLEIELSTIQ